MTLQIAIEPVPMRYGDKIGRGFRIRCEQCGKCESVHVSSIKHSTGDDNKELSRLIVGKAELLGWRADKKLLCPDCRDKRAKQMRAFHAQKAEKEKTGTAVAGAVEAVVAEPPKPAAPSRDDRRLIFFKLAEVYDDKQSGYSPGWSDAKLAKDLGIPELWVSVVREENFGPERNPHTERLEKMITDWRAQADGLAEEVRTVNAKINALAEQGQTLLLAIAELKR